MRSATYADNRSVGGQLSRDDVSCPITAKREGFRVERIDRYREDSRGWTCLTIPSRQTPIPEAVAFRLDFDRWLSQQSSRNRRLLAALASGDSTSEAANNFHVSRGRISSASAAVLQVVVRVSGRDAGTLHGGCLERDQRHLKFARR